LVFLAPDLAWFQDVVIWLDTKEVTTGGATNVSINFETAPNKETADFVALNGATPVNLSAGTTSVNAYLKDTATNALARWLRWTLLPTGGSLTSTWDATFRIWVAANCVGRSRPPMAFWRPDIRAGRGPM
jgi:hypothetical protein